MVLAILLAFPILEIVLLIKLGALYGWWLALYLVLAAVAGWSLIQEERLALVGRLFQVARQGGHPATALFATARKLIAGVLLIIPGVISDTIAVALLLMPSPKGHAAPAANDDIIEGEWRREDERPARIERDTDQNPNK